ncbi:MAG: hypothetical protein LBG76_08855 [Treponema sp.]|jgi:hypothetical protein|nr:hypothetical protein [Treponema sp.]
MIDRVLIDTLSLRAQDFAVKWKDKIRKAAHLKHYNNMDDAALMDAFTPVYPLLSRTLDRGMDRSLVGNFFVNMGKTRMREGFSISETIYAINLSQQVVIEYLMNDFVLDNSIRMYQAMGAMSKITEFYLLGCFYLTKGFLEATYTTMSSSDKVSEALLKKYFKDDFFFKKE